MSVLESGKCQKSRMRDKCSKIALFQIVSRIAAGRFCSILRGAMHLGQQRLLMFPVPICKLNVAITVGCLVYSELETSTNV